MSYIGLIVLVGLVIGTAFFTFDVIIKKARGRPVSRLEWAGLAVCWGAWILLVLLIVVVAGTALSSTNGAM